MFTSSGRELEVGVVRYMEKLGFSSTRFRTVSMFSLIILVRRGSGSLEGDVAGGHKSVDYSEESVTVRKLTW